MGNPDNSNHPERVSASRRLFVKRAAKAAPVVMTLQSGSALAMASNWVVAQVERVIEEDLSERQRQALTGVVIKGMPVEVVAERLGSNRNALYKLIFDARKRLRKGLEDRGLTPEGILDEL